MHDQSGTLYLTAIVLIVECILNNLTHIANEVIRNRQNVLEWRYQNDCLGLTLSAEIDSDASSDRASNQDDILVLDFHVVLDEVIDPARALEQMLFRWIEVGEGALAWILHD